MSRCTMAFAASPSSPSSPSSLAIIVQSTPSHRSVTCPIRRMARTRTAPTTVRACAPHGKTSSSSSSSSSDDDDDDKESWRHLEQAWRFQHRNDWSQRNVTPVECPECHTHGTVECRFCSATGVLTLGDKILCSVEGGTSCPVCNGRGEIRCEKCAGSGFIASWIVL